MAYASVVAENTYTSVSSTVSTFDLTKPSGVAVNDLLMLIVACDNATSTTSFAAKTGWTKQFEVGDAVPDAKIALYTRFATGSEGATETIDISATGPNFAVGWYVVVRGANYRSGGTYIGLGAPATNSSIASLAAAALTTTAAEALVFAFASYDGSDGGTFGITGTGWTTTTRRYLATTTSSVGSSAAWVTKQIAASATSTVNCTFSATLADGWSTIQAAIYPFVAQTVTATATDAGTSSQTAFVLRSSSASNSGTGTESASGIRIVDRTATDTGTGTEAATAAKFYIATALGLGFGTETADRLVVSFRTATDAGTGTESTTIERTRIRTASDSATGSETVSNFSIRLRTASDNANGTESALSFKTPFRTASAAGLGNEYADEVPTSVRFASASGLGTSTAPRIVKAIRTASSSGTGTSTTVRVVEPYRTGSAAGQASSVLTFNDIDTAYDFSMRNYDGGIGEATAFVIHVRNADGSGISTGNAVHSRILTSGHWGTLI